MRIYAKRGKELEAEVYELYRKEPYGWHAFVSMDKDFNPILYILNPKMDCLWKLVYEPHFRYGVRVEDANLQSFSDFKKFVEGKDSDIHFNFLKLSVLVKFMFASRDIKLIIFDLENVLFDKYETEYNGKKVRLNCWDTLFYELDAYEKSLELRELWEEGIFQDYWVWSNESCKYFKELKLTRKKFREVINKIPLTKNAKETLNELKRRGYKLATITGSLEELALRAKRILGLDYVKAHCRLYFDRNGFLKDWDLFPTDFYDKVECAKRIARKEKIGLEECAYVGDGENDVFIMAEVGLSIAFAPESEKVKRMAKVIIEKRDLKEILPYFPKRF